MIMHRMCRDVALAAVSIVVLGCSPSPPDKAMSTAAAPTPRAHWTYETVADAMTDAKIQTACTASLNEVSLSPPYHDVTAQLCIRDKPPKRHVTVFVRLDGAGQILCGLERCRLQARFDKDPVDAIYGGPPSDGSSNVVFFEEVDSEYFAVRMWKKKSVTVRLEFYQNGFQDIRFDITDYHGPLAYSGK